MAQRSKFLLVSFHARWLSFTPTNFCRLRIELCATCKIEYTFYSNLYIYIAICATCKILLATCKIEYAVYSYLYIYISICATCKIPARYPLLGILLHISSLRSHKSFIPIYYVYALVVFTMSHFILKHAKSFLLSDEKTRGTWQDSWKIRWRKWLKVLSKWCQVRWLTPIQASDWMLFSLLVSCVLWKMCSMIYEQI